MRETDRGPQLSVPIDAELKARLAFDQGHRVTESLEAARQNFRAALRAVLGSKKERAPQP